MIYFRTANAISHYELAFKTKKINIMSGLKPRYVGRGSTGTTDENTDSHFFGGRGAEPSGRKTILRAVPPRRKIYEPRKMFNYFK